MTKRRFIASITATAKGDVPPMPFERGAPRAAMIARRKAKPVTQQRVPQARSA